MHPNKLWIFVGLGLWLIVSPWLLGFAQVNTSVANNTIIGGALILMSLWALYGKK